MKRLFNYLTILFVILLLPTLAFAPPIRSGGPITYGGGGVATDIVTDTTNFDGVLSAADTTIQAALDTLDDAVSVRETSSHDYTASGNITEAHILASKYITNQGAGAEVDLVLPDLEYYITVIFIVNEAFIIEINPPNADAHEAFDLDGIALLDASDCIDSPAIVGSKIAAIRIQWDDGTWKWSFDTIRDIWVDTGATD